MNIKYNIVQHEKLNALEAGKNNLHLFELFYTAFFGGVPFSFKKRGEHSLDQIAKKKPKQKAFFLTLEKRFIATINGPLAFKINATIVINFKKLYLKR
jgi:hypothetical protein